ncbi:MAG: hypothetical protein HQ538_01785 [Parcubacteria group bacterium]|nr:hypothetical protein [Parcubacteria group bacterium]
MEEKKRKRHAKQYKDLTENDKAQIKIDKAFHELPKIEIVRKYDLSPVAVARVLEESKEEIEDMVNSSAAEIQEKVKQAFINQSVNFEVTIEKSLIKSTEEIEKRLEDAGGLTPKDLIAIHSKLFEQDRLNKEKPTGNETTVFNWFKNENYKPEHLKQAVKNYESNRTEVKQLAEKQTGTGDKGIPTGDKG